MVRLRRSTAVVLAIFTASGCVWLSSSSRPAMTEVRSAEIASGTPALPVFVLRQGVAHLSLDDQQAALARELTREMEVAGRPIDDARAVLVEVLVRAVDDRYFSEDMAAKAEDELIRTVTFATPVFDDALARFHAALAPWQRRALLAQTRATFAGWSTEWNGATSAADHPWLSSLAMDRLEKSGPDVVETARHWADRLIGEVRTKTGTELDDASRRELRARLRRANPK